MAIGWYLPGRFLIINGNTLVCSTILGLNETASYGLTLQLVQLLVIVSRTWLQVKIPTINQWRTQGKTIEIAILFASRLRLCLATFLLGAGTAFLAGPYILQLINARTELLPSFQFSILLTISFLEINHACYAAVTMTENKNPFLLPALISGILIVGLSTVLTPKFGVWGLLASQGLVQLCFNNWWTVLCGIRSLNMSFVQFLRILFCLNKKIQDAT
jgi:O-antigen/teichoic acid export membrane protein